MAGTALRSETTILADINKVYTPHPLTPFNYYCERVIIIMVHQPLISFQRTNAVLLGCGFIHNLCILVAENCLWMDQGQ